ncbi:MAG: ABC transporter substrate-binding protein [Candidatus Velthaea sp.]
MKRSRFVTSAAAAAVASSAIAPKAAFSAPNVIKGGTLTMMQYPNYNPPGDVKMKELLARWSSHHSGWNAEIQFVPDQDMLAKTASSVQANTGADIIQMKYNSPWLFADSCLDVTDVVDRVRKRNGPFYSSIEANSRVNGKFLAVPWYYTPAAWHYRKDLWSKVGKPNFVDTFDDLYTYGKKLKEASGIGVGLALGHASGDANTMWYGALWDFGGQEITADGKTIAINSKETEAALNWAIKMWQDKVQDSSVFSWDDSSNNRAYLAKTISATENAASIYLVARAKDKELADNTGTIIRPRGPKGRSMLQVNLGMSVMKWTKDPGAAKDLVDFLMQRQNYVEWLVFSGLGAYPGPALDKLSLWTETPKLKPFNDSVKFGRWPGWPANPNKQSSEAVARFIVVDMFAKACQSGDAKVAMNEAERALQQVYLRPT